MIYKSTISILISVIIKYSNPNVKYNINFNCYNDINKININVNMVTITYKILLLSRTLINKLQVLENDIFLIQITEKILFNE